GFRFLPRRKRRAVYAAYAFCRWADDIADEPIDTLAPHHRRDVPSPAAEPALSERSESNGRDPLPQAGEGIEERLARLDEWQDELERCYSGLPTHPITMALVDALQHFAIPKSAFVALIDGCRQDTVKTRYETFDELLQYCELVASSISDISLAIFGYRSEAAIGYGRKLSTALQLTNVTRDVGDDLGRDRIYLPQEDLRRFGVSERELFDHAENDRVRSLIEFQIARAEAFFKDAEPLLRELAFDARFPTLLMGGIYATVLGKLRKDPLVVIRKRLSLSPLQKLLVVGTRMLRPHFV
ncbi:MAG: phytoene/squalene synthase family protein, partial [Thermoanaerobaculia bacterium]